MSREALFAKIRSDFPILERKIRGHRLVYLDSAATTLKPKPVVQRISDYYLMESANVHRGAHSLSDEATGRFEEARTAAAELIGAEHDEVIFVRNTTEAVNLAAFSWADANLKSGDVILITEMEHHANIVPWQLLAERKGLRIEAVRVTDQGEIDLEDLEKKLKPPVKIFSFTGCSNTLGTIPPLKEMIKKAKAQGIKTLVDAAQLVSQRPINVRELDCDFLVYSGHKLFGPTGIGVLYAKKDILSAMPPWQGGGSMISQVTLAKTTYNEAPFRFEAGTPHIEGAIGLHAAIDYFRAIPWADLQAWEAGLLHEATEKLKTIPGITVYADLKDKGGIVSFNLKGIHHSDAAQILDQQGVAVRAGHHCTQPLMQRYGIPGTLRASFSIYNTPEDVSALIAAVRKAQELLS